MSRTRKPRKPGPKAIANRRRQVREVLEKLAEVDQAIADIPRFLGPKTKAQCQFNNALKASWPMDMLFSHLQGARFTLDIIEKED